MMLLKRATMIKVNASDVGRACVYACAIACVIAFFFKATSSTWSAISMDPLNRGLHTTLTLGGT